MEGLQKLFVLIFVYPQNAQIFTGSSNVDNNKCISRSGAASSESPHLLLWTPHVTACEELPPMNGVWPSSHSLNCVVPSWQMELDMKGSGWSTPQASWIGG